MANGGDTGDAPGTTAYIITDAPARARTSPLPERLLARHREIAEAVPALDGFVLNLFGAVGAVLHGRPPCSQGSSA